MKKRTKLFLLLLTLSCFFALFSAQSAAATDNVNAVDEYFNVRVSRILNDPSAKVEDHVVYMYAEPTSAYPKGSYFVVSYFDTLTAMKKCKKINIADEIDGRPVTAIDLGYDDDADIYMDKTYVYQAPIASQVTEIHFSVNLRTLGTDSFSCLPNLNSYEIPKTVQTIAGAFRGMKSLKSITIPGSVEIVGTNSFDSCSNLRKAVLKDGVKAVASAAFKSCKKLTSISIPSTVNRIGRNAFFGCPLKSVTIPTGCKLEGTVFGTKPQIKKIVFADQKGVFVLLKGFLADSETLTTIVLPRSAKTIQIQELACINCTALKKIVNTEKITVIGKKAFKGCAALNSFTLSAKIKSVGAGAFAGTGLKKLIVSGTKKAFLSDGGSAFLKTLPKGCKIYVKNNKMKNAFVAAGWQGKIILNKNLA
ncbi:MAG: leucine-rich repeat protein [Clostridia bacterium]|nr:leucine-rich repeat protein [Clostridia bacterium]